jgi:hypothetical protein
MTPPGAGSRVDMSAQEGHPPHPSTTHAEAGIHRLERVLRSYGPLTRQMLCELSGARRWPSADAFDAALDAAVAAGRVRTLGGVLFEAVDVDAGTARAPAATAL